MSYMGKDSESQVSASVAPAGESSEYRIDLRLLNAELNASVHSAGSIARLKEKPAKVTKAAITTPGGLDDG